MTKEQFDKLRKDKDYSSLGQIFFFVFATVTDKKERARFNEMYDSLTKKERKLLEQ